MSTAISAASVPSRDKFGVDKVISGGVTLLSIKGTLDNEFAGKKLAELVRTKKVVVNLREVRRFASWGMSEWMDFLRIIAEKDLYIVECSTYALSQINLVTGLLGHAKFLSYYASYRCQACTAELETLFLVPRDRELIRDLSNGHVQACPSCGEPAQLEEYPAAFFDTIASRSAFDIDDEVLAFLRSRFNYDLVPDVTRFRAYRRIQKGYTYQRWSGSIVDLPVEALVNSSEGTTVLDLEGVKFDANDVSQWRGYLKAATPKVKWLQLDRCPVGFIDAAIRSEDLHGKVKVRTFALEYECVNCERTITHMVDVADNLEHLVEGKAPTAPCPTCAAPLVAGTSPSQQMRLRDLPARDRDPALDAFLAKARRDPAEKLEGVLGATPTIPTKPSGGSRGLYLGIGAFVSIAAVAIVAIVLLNNQKTDKPVPLPVPVVDPTPPKPAFERPDWITSDIPASSYCHDLINRLVCVGVSSYRLTKDEGATEAADAALDELASTVSLKITDPFIKESVLPKYSEARSKAISALQAISPDELAASPEIDAVRKVRARIATLLRTTAGNAIPSQRSDWHWEEYARDDGKHELLVFVRYDVSLDGLRALVDKYQTSTTLLDSSLVSAFPGLAWSQPDFAGGVVVVKPGRPLEHAGIQARQLLVAVNEQPVADLTALVQKLDATPGDTKVTVKGTEGPAQQVSIRR